MQTLTFKYTKADGKTSERMLLALVTPTNKYAGIDVSELSPEHAGNFIRLAEELHAKYIQSLQRLQDEFDLTHNYRQFLESGVSDINKI